MRPSPVGPKAVYSALRALCLKTSGIVVQSRGLDSGNFNGSFENRLFLSPLRSERFRGGDAFVRMRNCRFHTVLGATTKLADSARLIRKHRLCGPGLYQ